MMKRIDIKICFVGILSCLLINTSYAIIFTSQYNENGSFSIFYEGQLPTAVALEITLPDNLKTDYTSCNVNSYYNFFPDWANDNPFESEYLERGHPIANIHSIGNLTNSVSNFCLSMAAFTPYAAYSGLQPIGELPTFDLNKDGCVDTTDLMLQNSNWLNTGVSLLGDLNGDMVINILDVGMMNGKQFIDLSTSGLLMTIYADDYDPSVNYGEIEIELNEFRGGIYEVPEPATFLLLSCGSLTLLRRKKCDHKR